MKEIIGNIIKAKTHKSRLSKENKTVDFDLNVRVALEDLFTSTSMLRTSIASLIVS